MQGLLRAREPVGEVFVLNRVGAGALPVEGHAPASPSPSMRPARCSHLVRYGRSRPVRRPSVYYEDRDDGTGPRCKNDANPARQGFLKRPPRRLLDAPPSSAVASASASTDNGDNDGFADPNETVSIFVTLRNSSGAGPRTASSLRLSSNDPKVDCILEPVAGLRQRWPHTRRAKSTAAVPFRVANVCPRPAWTPISPRPSTFAICGRRLRRHRPAAAGRRSTSTSTSAAGSSPPPTPRASRAPASAPSPPCPSTPARSRSPLSDGHPLPVQRPRLPELQLLREHLLLPGVPDPAKTPTTGTCTALASPDGGRAYLGTTRCTGACTPAPPARIPRA